MRKNKWEELCEKCGGKMYSTTIIDKKILLICEICMYSKIIIIEKETGAEDRI